MINKTMKFNIKTEDIINQIIRKKSNKTCDMYVINKNKIN